MLNSQEVMKVMIVRQHPSVWLIFLLKRRGESFQIPLMHRILPEFELLPSGRHNNPLVFTEQI